MISEVLFSSDMKPFLLFYRIKYSTTYDFKFDSLLLLNSLYLIPFFSSLSLKCENPRERHTSNSERPLVDEEEDMNFCKYKRVYYQVV